MNTCKCGRTISNHKRLCLTCMWQEAQRRAGGVKIQPKEIKTCKKCGKEFFPKWNTLRAYCSDACRKEAERARNRERRRHGICMICGCEFTFTGTSPRKRCKDCAEADIRKPYKRKSKKSGVEKSTAEEKAARLERLPEGANPKDAWMRDIGTTQIGTSPERTGARAVLKVDPASLRVPLLAATREWKGKSAEDAFFEKLAKEKKRQNEYDKKKKRNCHPRDGYTQDEDALILEMADSGADLLEISEILGRPKDGVKYRLKRLKADGMQRVL